MLIRRIKVVYLKSCPRCKGDLQVNKDFYGSYRKCFQCGYCGEIHVQPQTLIMMSDVPNVQTKLPEKAA